MVMVMIESVDNLRDGGKENWRLLRPAGCTSQIKSGPIIEYISRTLRI
jgi:hypothetical protein